MTPELETRIRATVFAIQDGWCTPDKAVDLANAILSLKATVSVEIGVFAGRSLVPMAMAHQEMKHGIVTGIDPWQANESVKGQDNENANWWSKVDHEIFYRKTLDTLERLGLTNVTNIIRSTSDEVTPPDLIDFFHCDGNHSEQSIKDVDRFASRVRDGGMVFLDDIHWGNGGVEKAREKLLGMGFEALFIRDTGEMFKRVSGGPKVKATVANVRGKGRPRKAK